MNKSILLIAIIIMTLSTKVIGMQDDKLNLELYHSLADSTFCYREANDLLGYLQYLINVHHEIKRSKHFELFYQITPFYDFFRRPYDKLESTKMRESFMCHASYVMKFHKDYDYALMYYLRAHELFKEDKKDRWIWYVENEIGNIYTRKGDYDRAEYFYLLVKRQLENFSGSRNRLSRLYSNFGRFYMSQSKDSLARMSFLQGIAISEDDHESLAANFFNLSLSYLNDGLIDRASGALEKLEKLDKIVLKKRFALIEELRGDILYKRNRPHEAHLHFNNALKKLIQKTQTNKGREKSKLYRKIADCFIEDKQYDKREDLVARGFYALNQFMDSTSFSIPKEEELITDNNFVDLLLSKSDIYLEMEEVNKSILCLKKAQKILQLMRYGFSNDLAYFENVKREREILELVLERSYKLYDKNTLSIDSIKVLFRQSKGILFNKKYGDNLFAQKLLGPDKLRYLDLRNDILRLLEKSVNGLNEDSLVLLHKRHFEISELRKNNNELKPKMINENYIHYIATNKFLYAYSSFDGVEKISKMLPTKRLNKMISDFTNELVNKNNDAWINKSNILFNNIFPKGIDLPQDITIIADGPLEYLNFELLSNESGLLLHNHLISYRFSPLVYNLEEESKMNFKIFCLAPDYTLSNKDICEVTRGGIYALDYAKEEATAIVSLFKNYMLQEIVDDKYKVIDELTSCDVFHYAGHAIGSGEVPRLILSSGSDSKDNFISHQMIEDLSIKAQLVTLSACETSLGLQYKGEGISSLARSFAIAGAGSVLSSLWVVNDFSTYTIMEYFYKNIKDGQTKSEALRNAKISFIEASPIELKHPYYWGGFIMHINR